MGTMKNPFVDSNPPVYCQNCGGKNHTDQDKKMRVVLGYMDGAWCQFCVVLLNRQARYDASSGKPLVEDEQ